MNKRFCDLCDRHVPESSNLRPEIDTPVPAMGMTCVRTVAVFTFAHHPTEFIGLPDLCEKCRYRLIVDLAEAIEPIKKDSDD